MNDFVGYIDDEGNVFDGTFQYEGQVGPIGPQGIPGYTPQRGVDYWTESDQETIVTEATSLIDGKIEEYNDNATAKTEAFNDNASDKTTTFNSNFTSKMNKFNQNSGEQKADFNANALDKTGDFNTNASDKTDAFDSHVTSKTTDFDSHVDDEFNELTGNFYTKSQTYSKDEVDGKVASTYHYKGSVTDYSYLPTSGQQVGDVYNLENAGGGYNAGDNVAWTGTDWDKLAGTVDLSNYYTKGQVDNIANTKQSVIDSSHKLLADNVDDTNQTNKFVSDTEKATWNNKSDFSGSYNDLTDKPDLTIYEEVANKTNELSGNSTTTEYPNAKCVYDWLDSITPTNEVSGTTINVQDSSNLPIKAFSLGGNSYQADTPTPDTPQNISVVTGDNTLYFRKSRNLFNENDFLSLEDWTKDSEGYTGATSKLYTAYGTNTSGLINIIPNAQYTVSITAKVSTSGGNARIQIIYSDDSYDESSTYINTKTFATYTITSNPAKTVSKIIFTYGSNRTITIQKFQIEIGATATEYEPYSAEQQTQLISLGSIELAKIGDYTDRIFKAVQGNSIYDSLDSTTKASLNVGSWYKENAISTKTLNGTETWRNANHNTTNTVFANNVGTIIADFLNGTTAISNYFYGKGNAAGHYDALTGGAGLYTGYSETSKYFYINILSSIASTETEFKNWLSTHNTLVYYVNNTPTYTEITDTTLIGQLENILKMHTNKNVTNGWIEPTGTNAQGGMVLVYRKDLQTLTDKTDSLEARITLLE